jgi:hypothetical protein
LEPKILWARNFYGAFFFAQTFSAEIFMEPFFYCKPFRAKFWPKLSVINENDLSMAILPGHKKAFYFRPTWKALAIFFEFSKGAIF